MTVFDLNSLQAQIAQRDELVQRFEMAPSTVNMIRDAVGVTVTVRLPSTMLGIPIATDPTMPVGAVDLVTAMSRRRIWI